MQCVNPLRPSDARDLGQHYSGNGLLPDGIETLPSPRALSKFESPIAEIKPWCK